MRVRIGHNFVGDQPQRTGFTSVGKVLCSNFPADQDTLLFLPGRGFFKQCWSSVEALSTRTQTR